MANLKAELDQFLGVGAKALKMYLGAVKPCNKKNATKIYVSMYDLDVNLLAYFREPTIFYAYDPNKICKTGDLVLIKELKEKKSTLITHEVLKVVYPLGDLTDPITNRKTTRIRWNKPAYRDELDKLDKLYGENPNKFIYENAPPRGWQEGKRDFTDKEITVRFHDDGTTNRYQRNYGGEGHPARKDNQPPMFYL